MSSCDCESDTLAPSVSPQPSRRNLSEFHASRAQVESTVCHIPRDLAHRHHDHKSLHHSDLSHDMPTSACMPGGVRSRARVGGGCPTLYHGPVLFVRHNYKRNHRLCRRGQAHSAPILAPGAPRWESNIDIWSKDSRLGTRPTSHTT